MTTAVTLSVVWCSESPETCWFHAIWAVTIKPENGKVKKSLRKHHKAIVLILPDTKTLFVHTVG